jgi:aspartyl-tRNA synthetase
MKVMEDMMVYVFSEVMDKCEKELETLRTRLEVPEKPFPRFSYDEVLEELERHGFELEWGEDIPTEALRKWGKLCEGFHFIIDWPTRSKPFYIKPRCDRPELSESFDLMYSWVEIASGGTRVGYKEELVRRLREQSLDPRSFEYHLRTFEYGMPPHAGMGLGLSRLMMVITNRWNIREVVLFPRDRFRLAP